MKYLLEKYKEDNFNILKNNIFLYPWGQSRPTHLLIIDLLKEPLENCNIFLLAAEEYEFMPGSLKDIFTKSIKKQFKKKNNRIYFLFGSSDLHAYTDPRNRYNYHQPKNNMHTILWPTFWLNRTFSQNIYKNRDFFLNKQMADFKKEEILYPYITMNNVGKYHRCLMIDLLAKEHLLDKGAVSWRNFCVDTEYEWKYTDSTQRTLSDFKNYDASTYDIQFTPPSEFYKSFMSIISETTTDLVFITEKTATALLYKQPFIVQGGVGFHKNLESLGFKLYDEIFDYAFDYEENLHLRTNMIIDNVKNIANQDFYELYRKIKPKLDYNHKLMIEIAKDRFQLPMLLKNNKVFYETYRKELPQELIND